MRGSLEMSHGLSRQGAWLGTLLLFAVGCVNLDKPASVVTCGNLGTCEDAAKGKDTAMSPDSPLVTVDAGSPDSTVQVDTKPVPVDTKPMPVDTHPDEAFDVPPDTLVVVDTQSPGMPDAALDATMVSPDAGTPDTTPVPVDVRPDTSNVPDVGPDAVTPTDTKPAGDAGTATVTFSAGRGQGAMTGYGWVTLGSLDSISSPTCVGGAAITSASPCLASTVWSKSNALCMTGSIPALSTTTPDYVGNWGVQVGVNAKEPNAAIGVAYSSITVNVTGSPLTGLRAELHRAGDTEGTTYCYLMTPGVSIPLTSFNTKCWEPAGGVAFTTADAAKIDKVGVQVSSTTAGSIAVDNLCLNSIVFGN